MGTGDGFAPGDAAAPPMSNGEVLFEAPWQGRVFGMACAMAEQGVFQWEEFRACLIDALAEAPAGRDAGPQAPFAYYDHFQRALERLLADKGLLSNEALAERVENHRDRPPGHDHGHHHDRYDRGA